MAYNGSGTFLINTAGQPVVPNTVISATAFNALTADLANGLSTCITKDGQTTPTANIPMGNNKITGLAPGTSGTDAANLSQVQGSTAKLLQSVTGTDTITAAMVPALTAYAAGQMFYFVAAGDNTGAVTINIDSLGAKSVTRDGSTALVAGDITNGKVVVIVYDGTRFQLLNSNAFTNLYVSGNLGVGTASPQHRLDVAYDANATSAVRVSNSNLGSSATATLRLETQGNTWTINNGRNGGFLSFSDGGGERARFDNAGKFGIGTTNPLFPLVVSAGGAQGLEFSPTALASAPFIQSYNRSSAAFTQLGFDALQYVFRTSGTEQMRLDSTGLGIGTSSPAVKLQVEGGSSANIVAIRGSAEAGSALLYTVNTNPGSPETQWFVAHSTSDVVTGNLRSGAYRVVTSNIERMRISSAGDVGIGTASPQQRVHVQGTGTTATRISALTTGNAVLELNAEGTDGGSVSFDRATIQLLLSTSGGTVGAFDANRNATLGQGSLATNATNGFLYVPTCAGTPTGTPTAKTGYAPIVVNTTNNKLYFYSGGTWRDAGP